jgi:hypothetical protein
MYDVWIIPDHGAWYNAGERTAGSGQHARDGLGRRVGEAGAEVL